MKNQTPLSQTFSWRPVLPENHVNINFRHSNNGHSRWLLLWKAPACSAINTHWVDVHESKEFPVQDQESHTAHNHIILSSNHQATQVVFWLLNIMLKQQKKKWYESVHLDTGGPGFEPLAWINAEEGHDPHWRQRLKAFTDCSHSISGWRSVGWTGGWLTTFQVEVRNKKNPSGLAEHFVLEREGCSLTPSQTEVLWPKAETVNKGAI